METEICYTNSGILDTLPLVGIRLAYHLNVASHLVANHEFLRSRMPATDPHWSARLTTTNVWFSAGAAGGVLHQPGQLCTTHRPLARDAADGPLSTSANVADEYRVAAKTAIMYRICNAIGDIDENHHHPAAACIPRASQTSRSGSGAGRDA
ncbi:MAG: hypothetical protein ACYCVU_10595, partial [Gammaproteobacteria bacterium]